jgi:hypothetical protein
MVGFREEDLRHSVLFTIKVNAFAVFREDVDMLIHRVVGYTRGYPQQRIHQSTVTVAIW